MMTANISPALPFGTASGIQQANERAPGAQEGTLRRVDRNAEIVALDGSPIRTLRLDPSKNYQRQP
jgi:hypothetical protein